MDNVNFNLQLLYCILIVLTATCANETYVQIAARSGKDVKSNRETSTGIQVVHTYKELMNVNWEIGFANMPYVVCFLGQLVLISNMKDFELHKNETYQYKHLGQSRFQPALIQLAITARRAFKTAQVNSMELKILMMEIPMRIQQISDVMINGNEIEFETLLQVPIDALEIAMDRSVVLSRNIVASFVNTMELMDEIEVSIAATKSFTEKELEELKRNKTILEAKHEQTEKMKKRYETEYKKVTALVEDYRQQYKDALDNIPTGWEAVIMGLIEKIDINEMIKTITSGGKSNTGGNSNTVDNSKQDSMLADKNALKYADNLSDFLQGFLSSIEDSAFINESSTKDILNQLVVLQSALQTNLKAMGDKSSAISQEVKRIYNSQLADGKSLIKKLEKPNKKLLDRELTVFKASCDARVKIIRKTIDMGYNQTQYDPALAPGASTEKESNVGKNARFVAKKVEAALIRVEERETNLFNSFMQFEEISGNQLIELKSMNISKLNLEEIKRIILLAIVKISSIKAMWEDISRLFELMAICVKASMKTGVDLFLQYAEKIRKNIKMTQFRALQSMEKRRLMTEVLRVSSMARACHIVTSAYVNASSDSVMSHISSIAGLQAVTSRQNQLIRMQLADNATTEVEKIKQYAKQWRRGFKQEIAEEKQKIYDIFNIDEKNDIRNTKQIA